MQAQINSECLLTEDLARHAGDAILAIDAKGRVLRMNPMAEELLGQAEGEVVGRHCQDVLRSTLCEQGCPLAHVLERGEPVTSPNVELGRTGRDPLPVCIVSTALRNAEGEPVGIVESIRDARHMVRLIEEREEAVAETRKTATWLEAIVDTIQDAVIASDTSIRITSFNRMAEIMTGYGRQEVLGRSCQEVFSNGFCPIAETLSGGVGLPGMDLTIRAKDGRAVPVWLTTELLRDGDGVVVGAVQLLRDRSRMASRDESSRGDYAPLVGEGAAMQEVYRWIDRLALTDATVLLQGESGTGKELVAELLHLRSPRRNKPLIRVNCAALPETLLESELFGHTRGAFTGAVQDRPGRFELAHHGTLFLDEIGDLPLSQQVKLLRVLQERSVERLGSGRPVPLDIRVIAATNRDLLAMVAERTFREDLYYRLAVVPVTLPPLREHPEDIEELAAACLGRLQGRLRAAPSGVSAAALRALSRHTWPGNVRELENALEYAAVRSDGGRVELQDLPPGIRGANGEKARPAPPEVERERMASALRQNGSAAEAASALGVSRATLFRRMKQHGLRGSLLKSH